MSPLEKQQKKAVMYLGGCLALVVVIIAAIAIPLIVSHSRRASRIQEAMQGQPDATVSAQQFVDDRQGKVYNGKVVQISGVVHAQSLNASNVLLYVGDTAGSQDFVLCFFTLADGPQIKALVSGSPIKIRGVAYTGGVPMLRQCRIEP